MAECDPNTTIPRTCAESFQAIAAAQAAQSEKLGAIYEQTMKTNGLVADLFVITSANTTRIHTIEREQVDNMTARAKWVERIWKALVGGGLVLLGYLLKG